MSGGSSRGNHEVRQNGRSKEKSRGEMRPEVEFIQQDTEWAEGNNFWDIILYPWSLNIFIEYAFSRRSVYHAF